MISGRADTDAKKREVLEHIFDVWTAKPELRLGQLICCTVQKEYLFTTEDYALVDMLERFK